jgi:hypothetical protein
LGFGPGAGAGAGAGVGAGAGLGGAATVWVSAASDDSLPVSPEYVAVTWWVAAVQELTARVAVPVVAVLLVTGEVPSVSPGSPKVTVPEGASPVTVAVSVTVCPTVDGFALDTSVVVVVVVVIADAGGATATTAPATIVASTLRTRVVCLMCAR